MSQFPESLLQGYADFRAGNFNDHAETYETLAEKGQNPSVLIIACSDSRAAPETIFNAAPGDLFIVRNVANLVPPYNPVDGHFSTPAALEFAVQALGVEHIVVMGHASCGGIKAALDPNMEALSPGDFIGKWMDLVRSVAEKAQNKKFENAEERQTALERMSIKNSLENLRKFPFIRETESAGKLSLHGAWFDISKGELWTMDPVSGGFDKAPS